MSLNNCELRVAAVLHVAASAFQGLGQHGPLVRPSPRLTPSVTSMRIGTPRSRSNWVCRRNFALSFAARGSGSAACGQHGQALQQRAIDQRQGVLHVFQTRIAGDGLELCGQFGDDFLQPLGLKHLAGFAQRA